MSWKTKLENRLVNDTVLNEAINEFSEYISEAVNAPLVNINHSIDTIKMVIQNQSALDKANEIMIGLTKLEDVVNVGDLVTWNNEDWLVLSKDDKTIKNCNKVNIQKTNNTLKFYKTTISSASPTLFSIPCIMTTGSRNYISTEENKFVSSPNSRYLCICPSGVIDKKDLHLRFIMNGYPYKVMGIDNVTADGILYMELNDDVSSPNDNLTLGIADYYNNAPTEISEEDNNELLL